MNKTVPVDEDIFSKIKIGDELAFNFLFEHFYSSLCFFSCKYVSDIDKARSLVQQVFVDIWVKREKLEVSRSAKAYMYNAVRNKSIDYLRKKKNTIQITEKIENIREVPFHDLIEETEQINQINNLINELPDKCREIFIMCRFEGMKYKQIAEKLDISIKTVEMQMGIALKKIRKKLSDQNLINLFLFFFSKNT